MLLKVVSRNYSNYAFFGEIDVEKIVIFHYSNNRCIDDKKKYIAFPFI